MTKVKIQTEVSTSQWIHATIDTLPPLMAGETDECQYVVGNPEGIRSHENHQTAFWGIDVRPKTTISAGQRRTLTLDHARPFAHKLEMPAAVLSDPLGHFGIPTLMGNAFALCFADGEPIKANGAHYEIHLRIRGVPLCWDLRLRWYPGDDSLMHGTLRVTNSDARYPSPVYQIPESIELGIDTLLGAGDWIGNGQSRVWPVSYRRDNSTLNVRRVLAIGFGRTRIGPLGGIAPRGAYDQAKWLNYSGDSFLKLLSWDAPQIGVSKRSGDAGDQEDQGYSQGFEPFVENADLLTIRAGLEAAWSQAKRPCHHLDLNGQPLDPEAQTPRMVYWNGTIHYDSRVSPNRHGKVRNLTEADTHGWWGPDNEHFLINRIAAAYELTGDVALHDELVHHALVYLGSETVDPTISNTHLHIARALGWQCLAMSHCYRLLRDRELADRVRMRVATRIEQHRAAWGTGLWDVRPNPGNYMGMPASVAPFFCMTYQGAVGAFGVYVACITMGLHDKTDWAVQAAARIVDLCYPEGNEILGLAINDTVTARRNTGTFYRAWLPLALYVAIRGLPVGDTIRIQAQEARHRILDELPNPLTEWSHFDDWMPPVEVTP